MYSEAARFYDVIHDSRGRDAAREADLVLAEARRHRPDIRTLLDVGCGTGAHLPRFAEVLDDVVGVDLSPQMLELAAIRAPNVRLIEGGFESFDLDVRFDVVVSLFSGIGYLTEEEDLRAGIFNLARHLEPGGVMLVEGWVEPEFWLGSSVNAESGVDGDLAVARVVDSRRIGPHTVVDMRYVAATPTAMVTADERHTMRLSDPVELASAFDRAGMSLLRLPHMLHSGRAVYVGIAS
jgi:dTDP-3-amino-3,6-dideoxy-alpha-D-glucopyranose N,N-dimethyltransferase/dTDP-3-amino-3,4,6-trideoxy-alpha-D-glucopyranose N,N-dimethyltransferase